MEESPPAEAPQQVDCSLVAVQPRQLRGAAAERLDGSPRPSVGVGELQLGVGRGVVEGWRQQDPEEGGQPVVLLGVSSVFS